MKSYKNQQLLEDIYYSNWTKYLLLIASVNNFCFIICSQK